MSIRYPLHYLDDKEFENLVALICEKILGTGTIVFSDGKNGGRDALFTQKNGSGTDMRHFKYISLSSCPLSVPDSVYFMVMIMKLIAFYLRSGALLKPKHNFT